MDLIKNKKYTDALKMIEKSKEWPENLGVGKPFEVDTRIQDYLQIFCLDRLKRSGETSALKDSIINYTNQNFAIPSFGNYLGIKLLKEKGDEGTVSSLLQKTGTSGRGPNPVQQWVIASAKNDQAAIGDLEKDLTKNNAFLIIKKLIEVTGR
jgi:hypothetical protein